MEHYVWAFVALAFIYVVNYRLGEFLNPPLLEDMKTLKNHFDMLTMQVSRLQEKLNSVMVDKGFKND